MDAQAPKNEMIESLFSYHKADANQTEKFERITNKVKELAYLIEEVCPSSREKSLAITTLQELRMWANASIAIHGGTKVEANPAPTEGTPVSENTGDAQSETKA